MRGKVKIAVFDLVLPRYEALGLYGFKLSAKLFTCPFADDSILFIREGDQA